MRTTVNIDDRLLDWARQHAQTKRVTLGDLIDEALQHLLTHPLDDDGPDLPVFRGRSDVMPGIDLDSNRSMFDALDDSEGRQG